MDSNLFDDEEKQPVPPAVQTMKNKLLPWAVLLLAALGLLYFLNRGCAGAKTSTDADIGNTEEPTGSIVQSSGTEEIETREAQSKQATDTTSNTPLQKQPGTLTILQLKESLEIGEVNPNAACVLDDVRFEGSTATLTSNSGGQLNQLVEMCQVYPGCQVRIEGHTDNTGNADMNVQLSRQRALAVKSYLQKRGVDPTRINVVGRGQVKPIAPNDTKEGKARNTRIEVYVLTN